MKKMLLAGAALLCSYAAMAQAPAAMVQNPAAETARPPQDAKAKHAEKATDDRKDAKPDDNHGQTVSSFATTTTLPGADKGAAVSKLASGGRAGAHRARGEHDRPEHGRSANSHAAGHANAHSHR